MEYEIMSSLWAVEFLEWSGSDLDLVSSLQFRASSAHREHVRLAYIKSLQPDSVWDTGGLIQINLEHACSTQGEHHSDRYFIQIGPLRRDNGGMYFHVPPNIHILKEASRQLPQLPYHTASGLATNPEQRVNSLTWFFPLTSSNREIP